VGAVVITTGSNFEMGWGWNVGVDNTENAIDGRGRRFKTTKQERLK